MNFDPDSIVFALRNRDAVTIEELVQFTGALPSDYYKYLYENKHIVPCSPPTDHDIEIFLKFCQSPELEKELCRSGVFFDINAKVLILEAFHSVALSSASTWPLDESGLQTLIWGSRDPAEAVGGYFDMYIGKEALLTKVSKLIVQYLKMDEKDGPEAVSHFIYRELNSGLEWLHIRRHFISILFERAVQLGFIEAAEALPCGEVSAEAAEALKVLGLTSVRLPAMDELKSAYRNQLLKNHPDIKADGTEATVLINEAYAFVLPLLKPA